MFWILMVSIYLQFTGSNTKQNDVSNTMPMDQDGMLMVIIDRARSLSVTI